MSAVVVRPAREDEWAEVGRITLEAYLADGYLRREHSYSEHLLDAATRARDAELLVAADAEGRPVGTVTICAPGTPMSEISQPGELEFRMLAVEPSARGRGVGGALLDAVLARAAGGDYHGVVLSSLNTMTAAHRLYRRNGFVRATDRDWTPSDRVLLWAFTRTL